jgi:hypothetical protein
VIVLPVLDLLPGFRLNRKARAHVTLDCEDFFPRSSESNTYPENNADRRPVSVQ